MQHKRLHLCAVFLIGILLTGLQAQESIVTSGSNAVGDGGTSSFSVGQLVYKTNTDLTGSVAQGVQQPYEILLVTSIEHAEGITLSAAVYPNPTTDFLVLRINDFEIANLSYQLYDMQGKVLQTDKITANQTSISMGHLMPSSYFVKIIQSNKEVKVFKIVKK